MKTTENTSDPLAEFPEQLKPLRSAKTKLDAELQDNLRKLADAEAERAEYQQAGPPDEELVRKLAEAHIRCELYRNHQVKLEASANEVRMRGCQIVSDYAARLREIALNCESLARQQLVASLDRLVVNGQRAVIQSLNSFGLTSPLVSHEEVIARELAGAADRSDHNLHSQDPFAACERLQAAWQKFQQAIGAANQARLEPLLVTPA